MTRPADLRIRIFADGAELAGIVAMAKNPLIKGFTTNPTLMHKAGIVDYKQFAQALVAAVPDRPISLEVFSDDFDEMEDQALEIASWGSNVNVKVPITNTKGKFTGPLIGRLSAQGVCVNVTALMTVEQVTDVLGALQGEGRVFISVFAGRIADTGRDPVPVMAESARLAKQRAHTETIWASPRELLNVFQAEAAGVDVITVANDLLKKLDVVGKDLVEYSLDTVRMFRDDAVKAGYAISRSNVSAAR